MQRTLTNPMIAAPQARFRYDVPRMTDSSDQVATPGWRLRSLPEIQCPACGYDLNHAPTPRCSECGYELQENDIEYVGRRQSFLVLTRHAAIVRVFVVLIAMSLAFPYAGPILAAPPLVSGLFLAAGKGPGLASRIRRRIWLMSSFWLQVPWMIVGGLNELYDMLHWRYLHTWNLSFDDLLPPEIAFVGAVLLFAGGLWAWRWSLRRMVKDAALPNDDLITRWRSAAARIALMSYGLVALVAVPAAMMWVLDTFWPGWA